MYTLFVGIALGLFYLAFRHTEWAKLRDDFNDANWSILLLSAALGFYAYVARGFRWNLLLRSMAFNIQSPWSAVHGIALGYFSNLLIPRSGELFRCTAMHRAERIPVDRLLGTVILERLVDLIMLAMVFVLGFLTNWSHMLAFFNARGSSSDASLPWGWILLVLVVLVVIFAVLRHFRYHSFFTRIRSFLRGVLEGLRSFRSLSLAQRWRFVFYTLQIWAMYFFMVYVVFFAIDSTNHLTLSDGLFLMVVGSLGMIIPTPGGIGSYHFLMMTGLAFLGVDKSDGMSFGTIVHSTQMVMTVLAGLLGFLYLGYREKRNADGKV